MRKNIDPFSLVKWPEINYGSKVLDRFFEELPVALEKVLWITGGKTGHRPAYFDQFLSITKLDQSALHLAQISGEPTPETIDAICTQYRPLGIELVVGIGGGSPVDAAKAIAALLVTQTSLLDHLEGVGAGVPLDGNRVLFIAVPTTSGTGSEMTANAVFSKTGEQGYKKSIRHKQLVPDQVWIDPRLMASCPPLQTASSGLDAFTQLLEAYLSTKANPITDALAFKGLQLVIENLEAAWRNGSEDVDARGGMAIASALSGACLANAGLGIVHGLAGPIGGFFAIPHGVVCAGLVAKANEINERALQARGDAYYLKKMSSIGRLFGSGHKDDIYYCQQLTDNLYRWEKLFAIPKFSQYGITESHVTKIVNSASNRNNPVDLTEDEITELVRYCI